MPTSSATQVRPAVLRIQRLLQKIDRLPLPSSSRRDVESILVRQVSNEIDRALPGQTGHGEGTAVIASMIGQALALDPVELHNLKLAGWLHDVGLLMLPAQLRASRGSLEPESYVAIQNHSRLGATLLEPFTFLREASILIAHHHERWDGSGYPYSIRGEYIPLGARILAIADAFDAIRIPDFSEQAVRNAIALKILGVAAGTQFDPHLVTVLTQVINDHSLSTYRSTDRPLTPAWHS